MDYRPGARKVRRHRQSSPHDQPGRNKRREPNPWPVAVVVGDEPQRAAMVVADIRPAYGHASDGLSRLAGAHTGGPSTFKSTRDPIQAVCTPVNPPAAAQNPPGSPRRQRRQPPRRSENRAMPKAGRRGRLVVYFDIVTPSQCCAVICGGTLMWTQPVRRAGNRCIRVRRRRKACPGRVRRAASRYGSARRDLDWQ